MAPWRQKLYTVIFEAETPAGKAFDVALIIAILLSIVAVMLESVKSIDAKYHRELAVAEWVFTILFTLEYVLRLICIRRPWRYAVSFFGIIDLLAVVPTYLTLIGLGTRYGIIVRSLRLLRIFRIFHINLLVREANILRLALFAARAKVVVFLLTVLIIVTILGTAMYLIEGEERGFTSIPESIYWGIVTMTTVGYGDIVPHTPLGKIVAALMIIMGYSLIIVPMGILSTEMVRKPISTRSCQECMEEGHDADAVHCKYCGSKL